MYKSIVINSQDNLLKQKNPIFDFFINKNHSSIKTLDEFTQVVRQIEEAKNYDPELFIKLLIYHRIIEGNGNKTIYYIGMMVLREEDPNMYEKILKLLNKYPKDILRLCRIFNFIGQINSQIKINLDIIETTCHRKVKLNMWNKINSDKKLCLAKEVHLSIETKLYGDLIYKSIKELLKKNFESEDINLILFKYLSYESGHFNLETMFIWKYVEKLLSSDLDLQLILSENLGEISDEEYIDNQIE